MKAAEENDMFHEDESTWTPPQQIDGHGRIAQQAYSASAVLDPSLAPVVTASLEEIRYAERLRFAIKQRYLKQANRPVSWWCVGAD